MSKCNLFNPSGIFNEAGTKKKSYAINNCPKCKSHENQVQFVYDSYNIICLDCNYSSSPAECFDDAVRNWNRGIIK